MHTRARERTSGPSAGTADAGTPSPEAALIPRPAAYLVTDPSGVILHADPVAGSILGIDVRRLVSMPLRALVVHEERPVLRGLLVGGEDSRRDGAVRLAVPGGRTVHAELSAHPQRDDEGRVVGLRWRLREPWTARAEARRLRARVEELERAGWAMCGLGADGTVAWVDLAAEGLLGRAAGELVGRRWSELAEAEGSALERALRAGREGRGSAQVRRGDGSLASLEYLVVPVLEHDRVSGAVLALAEVAAA